MEQPASSALTKNTSHKDYTYVASTSQLHSGLETGSASNRLWRIYHDEIHLLRPRVLVAQLLLAPLPPYVGSRVRAALLRLLGFSLGHGTVLWGLPKFSGTADLERLLKVGKFCRFNTECVIDLNAPITIGNHVDLGHQVMLLTSSHEIGGPNRRSSHLIAAPITIGDGCWLGARSIILPGVTIGEGSVIAAGSVVTKDVPPNTLVAGVPAHVIRQFDA